MCAVVFGVLVLSIQVNPLAEEKNKCSAQQGFKPGTLGPVLECLNQQNEKYQGLTSRHCPASVAMTEHRTRDRQDPGSKLACAICFFPQAKRLIGIARWPRSLGM